MVNGLIEFKKHGTHLMTEKFTIQIGEKKFFFVEMIPTKIG